MSSHELAQCCGCWPAGNHMCQKGLVVTDVTSWASILQRLAVRILSAATEIPKISKFKCWFAGSAEMAPRAPAAGLPSSLCPRCHPVPAGQRGEPSPEQPQQPVARERQRPGQGTVRHGAGCAWLPWELASRDAWWPWPLLNESRSWDTSAFVGCENVSNIFY